MTIFKFFDIVDLVYVIKLVVIYIQQRNTEGHKDKLMNLCRLCCMKIKNVKNKYSLQKEIKTYKIEKMKLFNYDITSDKKVIHPIYVCDACQHKLNRCCNSEMEFTMMAEFYDHNPRAVGCVHTS